MGSYSKHLLTFPTYKVDGYFEVGVLIQGWALNQINTV